MSMFEQPGDADAPDVSSPPVCQMIDLETMARDHDLNGVKPDLRLDHAPSPMCTRRLRRPSSTLARTPSVFSRPRSSRLVMGT